MSQNASELEDMLIPFDLRSPCPKCEGRGMDGRYCTGSHLGQLGYEVAGQPEIEHLDLTCQWCGYTRYMATADGVRAVQERIVSG